MPSPITLLGTDAGLSIKERLVQHLNAIQDEMDAIELRYQFLKGEIVDTKRALAGIERSEHKARLSVAKPKSEPKSQPTPEPTPKTERKYVRVSQEQFRDFYVERQRFTLKEAAAFFNIDASRVSRQFTKPLIKAGKLEWVGSPKSRDSFLQITNMSTDTPPRIKPESPEEMAKKLMPRQPPKPRGGHTSIGKFSANKEIRKILATCRGQKCTIERLGNDHIRIINKDGISLQISSTPKHPGTIDAIKRGLRKKLSLNI